MIRWSLHILSVISLILMIASCVAWGRSYWRTESAERVSEGVVHVLAYGEGEYKWSRMNMRATGIDDGSFPWIVSSESADAIKSPYIDATDDLFDLWVVQWYEKKMTDAIPLEIPFTAVFVHIWFVTLLLSLMPTSWLLVYRKRCRRNRRIKLGLCAACGYDMQGSLDGGECPECGDEATVKA